MFSKLHLHNWRQFENIDLEFHPRLTVLTGANGSGKTTLLHLLNRHWGWSVPFLSGANPDSQLKEKYWAGFWGEENGNQQTSAKSPRDYHDIGGLTYASGKKATLAVPKSVRDTFGVNFAGYESVPGVFVPSHRAPYVFQVVEEVPVKLDAKQQIFDVYLDEVRARYGGGYTHPQILSPSFQIKRSLISLALFGYGNRAVERNDEAIAIFEGFQRILQTILPATLGFQEFKIRMPEVFLSCAQGDFPLEAVSGGVAAIIDMAWQIHMYAQLHEEFVVVIDEPEAHLHPALQQRLLPDFLTAFPKCQFVIATHSPFLVSSVADSNVYVLQYNAANRVESTLLDTVNKAGTADEILMDVLGLPSTLPNWAKAKVETILNKFVAIPLSNESIAALRSEMSELGLAHLFPEVLAGVAEGQR